MSEWIPLQLFKPDFLFWYCYKSPFEKKRKIFEPLIEAIFNNRHSFRRGGCYYFFILPWFVKFFKNVITSSFWTSLNDWYLGLSNFLWMLLLLHSELVWMIGILVCQIFLRMLLLLHFEFFCLTDYWSRKH